MKDVEYCKKTQSWVISDADHIPVELRGTAYETLQEALNELRGFKK